MDEMKVENTNKKKLQPKWFFLGGVIVVLFLAAAFIIRTNNSNIKQQENQEKNLKLYFLNQEKTKIVSETCYAIADNDKDLLPELIHALNNTPEEAEHKKAKPDEVNIIEYSFSNNGLLTLYFDSGYLSVAGSDEVLMRAAIVKTLCQIKNVNYIEFYINDQPLLRSSGKPVGMMKEEDFIDNTGLVTEFYQNIYVTVYFSNEAGDALKESNLKITYDGTIPTEQLILNQLIKGPIEAGMKGTIPEGTVINKVVVKDGVCYVDFNDKFIEKRPDVSEQVTVFSVVNSLVEQPNIYKVQITIDGETQKLFQSLNLGETFERNLDLIAGEH